ncbi:hypothetical protein FDECE_4080 [Fusarium decemcellulare]|nr:hypothetical protein FDECE_4080 [Fusarium decemcellulare]
MASLSGTSISTEVFTTPPSSPLHTQLHQHQVPLGKFPTCLDVPFAESSFLLPDKVLGICCSGRDVWYSKLHWPDDPRFADLFRPAAATQRRLMPDFDSIWQTEGIRKFIEGKALSTTPYMYEQRMAGVREANQAHITLRPSFWIRTTDDAIKRKTPWKRLTKLVKDLGLNSPQNVNIYVEGGLKLAHDTTRVPKAHLPLEKGTDFGDGETLYTHIPAKPPGASACGTLCLTTIIKDGVILYQKHSRIGGLVNHGTSRLGLTSGHVMLEHFLGHDLEDISKSESLPELEDSGQESDDDLELVENGRGRAMEHKESQNLGHVDLDKVMRWIPVMLSHRIAFVGYAAPAAVEDSLSRSLAELSRMLEGSDGTSTQGAYDPSRSSQSFPNPPPWTIYSRRRMFANDIAKDPTWRFRPSEQPTPADFALISGLAERRYENYYLNSLLLEQRHDDNDDDDGNIAMEDDEYPLAENINTSTDSQELLLRVPDRPEEKKRVSGYIQNIFLTTRTVLILTGDTAPPIVASLQATKVPLVIGGAQFWTRRLLLSAPLVFDHEPCALMTTAETMLSDLNTYSPGVPHIQQAISSFPLPNQRSPPTPPAPSSSMFVHTGYSVYGDPEPGPV